MSLVDLHTHTTASDGTDTPAQLMALAKEAGLVAVAVTDHDTVSGLDEAEAAITRGQRALVSDEDPLGALENLRDVELRMDAILAPLMTQK